MQTISSDTFSKVAFTHQKGVSPSKKLAFSFLNTYRYTWAIWGATLMALLAISMIPESYLSYLGYPRFYYVLSVAIISALLFHTMLYDGNKKFYTDRKILQKAIEQLKTQEEIIDIQKEMLTEARQTSEEVLQKTLPQETINEILTKGYALPHSYSCTSILFSSFQCFDSFASQAFSAEDIVASLDYCFSAFDDIMTKYKIEKVKTVGSTYIAIAGGPIPIEDHAQVMVKAALDMQHFIKEWNSKQSKVNTKPWQASIGINTGPVITGVVGKRKFSYDIWGNTVATAHQIEALSKGGAINISKSTHALVKNHFDCDNRKEEGSHHKTEMYWVKGHKKKNF